MTFKETTRTRSSYSVRKLIWSSVYFLQLWDGLWLHWLRRRRRWRGLRLGGLCCFVKIWVSFVFFGWASSDITVLFLQSCTEYQEASQDSLQQVPRQYGRAQSREDIAAGRAGHPGAFYELFQGQHTCYIFTVSYRDVSTAQEQKHCMYFYFVNVMPFLKCHRRAIGRGSKSFTSG